MIFFELHDAAFAQVDCAVKVADAGPQIQWEDLRSEVHKSISDRLILQLDDEEVHLKQRLENVQARRENLKRKSEAADNQAAKKAVKEVAETKAIVGDINKAADAEKKSEKEKEKEVEPVPLPPPASKEAVKEKEKEVELGPLPPASKEAVKEKEKEVELGPLPPAAKEAAKEKIPSDDPTTSCAV